MVQVTFVRRDGSRRSVKARSGQSLMEAAIDNGVDGIDAVCGGACSCATCHVYVDDDWLVRLSTPAPLERELIGTLDAVRPSSRLSCQIKLCDDLDGLVVTTPAFQQQ